MSVINWISNNNIELFGAVAGIVYVFLEIRQNIFLWPVGIVTSAAYIWVFFTGKLYADMSLQVYYLLISILGWYWWVKSRSGEWEKRSIKICQEAEGDIHGSEHKLAVRHINTNTALVLLIVFAFLFSVMWIVLDRFTDSPVPGWDSYITSLSVIATWMLARKIIEHWYLWMMVNITGVVLFVFRGLYPTAVLYAVYFIMSFVGLTEWRKSLKCLNLNHG